jgi:L-aspartate oxidase
MREMVWARRAACCGFQMVKCGGDRFAFAYHRAGELAPRDIVSRAIYSHLQKNANQTGLDHVFLDLRPIEPGQLRYRFPNIIQRCQQWGIDPFTEPIPVAPAAHYWMGGIKTNLSAQSSISGLYAIGETASTGVHGANRLASNSLLECIVFAGQLAHLKLSARSDRNLPIPIPCLDESWEEDYELLQHIRHELPILLWKSAGISRSQPGLTLALAQVQQYQQELSALKLVICLRQQVPALPCLRINAAFEKHWQLAAETLNLIDVAYLILSSALFRTESRGGHFRLDYPQADPLWQGHTLIEGDRWYLGSNLDSNKH